MKLKDYFSRNLARYAMDEEGEKDVRRQKFWTVHLMFLEILHLAWNHGVIISNAKIFDDSGANSTNLKHYSDLRKNLSFET